MPAPDQAGDGRADDPSQNGAAEERHLEAIVHAMRETSLHADPQEMVKAFRSHMRSIFPLDDQMSLSRRGLEHPRVRITRWTRWSEELNPWKHQDRLPIVSGGLLADLIYSEKPVILTDYTLDATDPARGYLEGYRSLMAVPHFHHGRGTNMVISLSRAPDAFKRERLADTTLISNLFGRATQNLVLSAQLQEAYQAIDRELKVVASIQRSLLPPRLPRLTTLDLAATYQTSQRAGGDYYDLFPLGGSEDEPERMGIFIADVSGHGTPAAVVMAITHAIAHAFPREPAPPHEVLEFLNGKLSGHYTGTVGGFVTAFYAVYDARAGTLEYARAGHNPPLLRRAGVAGGCVTELKGVGGIPLGIMEEARYTSATERLAAGDLLLFYTDGITESFDGSGDMFGEERLERLVLDHQGSAQDLVDTVLEAVDSFTGGRPAGDDRTLLAARVV